MYFNTLTFLDGRIFICSVSRSRNVATVTPSAAALEALPPSSPPLACSATSHTFAQDGTGVAVCLFLRKNTSDHENSFDATKFLNNPRRPDKKQNKTYTELFNLSINNNKLSVCKWYSLDIFFI